MIYRLRLGDGSQHRSANTEFSPPHHCERTKRRTEVYGPVDGEGIYHPPNPRHCEFLVDELCAPSEQEIQSSAQTRQRWRATQHRWMPELTCSGLLDACQVTAATGRRLRLVGFGFGSRCHMRRLASADCFAIHMLGDGLECHSLSVLACIDGQHG